MIRSLLTWSAILCAGLSLSAGSLLQDDGWKTLRFGGRSAETSALERQGGIFRFNAAQVPADTAHWHLQLSQPVRLGGGKKHVLEFTIDSPAASEIYVSYRTQKNPRVLGASKLFRFGAGKHTLRFPFTPQDPDPAEDGSELSIQLGMLKGEFTLSGITLLPAAIPFRLGDGWLVFTEGPLPAASGGLPENSAARRVSVPMRTDNANSIDLARQSGSFSPKREAVLFNEFTSPETGYMPAGFSADYWMEIFVNGEKVYDTLAGGNGGSIVYDSHEVLLPVRKGKNLLAVRVLAGSAGWSLAWGVPREPVTYREGPEWKRVDLSSLAVRPGSALDLSMLSEVPAGKHGRARVSKTGTLEFENAPGRSVRLQGFSSGIPDDIWVGGSDEEFRRKARLFAQAARRQGYNYFRTHGLDQWLCRDSGRDMAISAKYLDRWDRLFAEFRQEGIYLQLVVLSFGLYSSNANYRATSNDRDMHKLMLNLGAEFQRERFRYGVNTLLNHVNPYTGLAWKDDPAIVAVEFHNEQYSGIARLDKVEKENPEEYAFFVSLWRDWLNRRYGSKPQKEWPAELRRSGLAAAPVPRHGDASSALANDLGTFFFEKTAEMNRWCEKTVREAGYPGLVTQNSYHTLYSIASSYETLPVIDTHSYFQHPTSWANPGSRVGAESSVGQLASNFRGLNSTRIAGRPMFVGEFNHCFWNPYQHEAGLVMGGYAAFQDYSMLSIHSHPVLLEGKPQQVSCFFAGNSAVSRAGEFLAGCLFRRGDLTPSRKQAVLSVPNSWLFSGSNTGRGVSSEQNKLTLLCGFGLTFPELPKPAAVPELPEPDLAILPAGAAQVQAHDWFTQVLETADRNFSLAETVRAMKKRGILSASNRTDPERGIFESDTGELLLDAGRNVLKITTPRTEAATLPAGCSETLNALSIESSSVPACVGVCAMDGKTVEESRRLVLVYSTEMANSGQQLGADLETLKNLGGAPVLLRTGRLKAALRSRNAGKTEFYALGLDGSRREKLPLKAEGDQLRIELDTAKLKHGNTVFFELAAE
ncbi:MAG: hypothetical protein HPZ91_03255 [Lentisphaeria bacterium]|nr:hypothetical protein [Lentisphaeria bacterium]